MIDCFTGAGVYCIFLSRVVQDVGFRRDGIEVPLPGKVSWRSYYLAGGKRIAMRDSKTDEVTWFLSDHLGSTSTTLDAGGAVVGEQRYDPWGSVRTETGMLGTDYTYTGQRSESALGLMYYVARWYDPHIAHFVQADTIVPGAGNPAAWDRYGYVLNSPLKYTDPSGHGACDGDHPISDVCFDENNILEMPDWETWTYENWSTPPDGVTTEEWRHIRAGIVWGWLCQRPEGCPTLLEITSYLLFAESGSLQFDSKGLDIAARSIRYIFRNGISNSSLSAFTAIINPDHQGTSVTQFGLADWEKLNTNINLVEMYDGSSYVEYMQGVLNLEAGLNEDYVYRNQYGEPIIYFWTSYSAKIPGVNFSPAPLEGGSGWYNVELISNGFHYQTISFGGFTDACKAGFIYCR